MTMTENRARHVHFEDEHAEHDRVGVDSPPAAIAAWSAPEKPLKAKDAGRSFRRSLTIHGYFGRNGHGKSTAMVHDTIPDLEAGRPVLSTVRLFDPLTGIDYPNYERLTDWQQVIDFRGGAILFDEIVGVAGSREAMSLPVQIQNLLNQLRRRDITLRWTAPAWARADKIIRETSTGATLCRGYLAKPAIGPDGEKLAWSRRRLFNFKTYDAADFEEWTAAKEGKLKALTSSWLWGPGSEAQASYDTYDDVSKIGGIIDSGRCVACGGVKRAKQCTCGK